MTLLTLIYAAEFGYGIATGQPAWLTVAQAVILAVLVVLTARGYRCTRATTPGHQCGHGTRRTA